MVKGTNVVNLLFLVGFCWVEVGAYSKVAPAPPPTSLAYFPTNDGCYSYTANIEYESFTLNGKTFNRAVSPYKCIDEGTKSDAESFGDCAQQVIDGGYNSFYYDGNNAECSMHLFWVPKDNPLFSLDDPTNEYYTKRESSSGSAAVIIIDLTPNVQYQQEMVLYISEEMNTAYAANDQLNPVVKPSIKEFNYNITGKYEKINATVVLEGTTCLADIYMVEDGDISGDYSLDFESPEVVHIYRDIGDADSGCDTGDIYVFLDIIGDGDEVYPSVGIENVAEEQKNYIRNTVILSAIQPSLEWRIDGTDATIVRTILELSGDTSLVSKATVTYTDEDAIEITTIISEMVTSHEEADGDCLNLEVDVQLYDLYECPLLSSPETFPRSELLGPYATDPVVQKFDSCSVVGAAANSNKDGTTATTYCTEGFTLPILKSANDVTVFNEKANAVAWLGFVGETFAWQDDQSGTLSSEAFDPITVPAQAAGEVCSTADGSAGGATVTLTASNCGGEKKTVCWKNIEVLNLGG